MNMCAMSFMSPLAVRARIIAISFRAAEIATEIIHRLHHHLSLKFARAYHS